MPKNNLGLEIEKMVKEASLLDHVKSKKEKFDQYANLKDYYDIIDSSNEDGDYDKQIYTKNIFARQKFINF